MKPKLRPIHRNGDKNIYCPYYDDCLSHAAKRHWQSWDCSECAQKQNRQTLNPEQIGDGPAPYYELPSRIFRQVERISAPA